MIRLITGKAIVLPDPGSDESTEIDEESIRIEKAVESFLEVARTAAGGEITAGENGGGEVKVHMDALNEIIRAIATGGIVVLPNPTSDEQAELDENSLRMEKAIESLSEHIRTPEGGTLRAEATAGGEVEVAMDALAEEIRAIALGGMRVLPFTGSDEQARLDEEALELEKATESLARLLRIPQGVRLEGEDLSGGGGIVGLDLDAVNNQIVDNAQYRIQTDGNLQFLRFLDNANNDVILQGWAPGTQPAGIIFIPDVVQPEVYIAGQLSKPGGSFKIDHPLDPDNKYLYHSFVESPDMMNVYNGNITTDASGNALVEMPDYFSALNKDFRYQLTVIGTFAQAIISQELDGNNFQIKTDQPNVKVSWQVTGVRNDDYAKARRIKVEVEKEESMKGKRLFENK